MVLCCGCDYRMQDSPGAVCLLWCLCSLCCAHFRVRTGQLSLACLPACVFVCSPTIQYIIYESLVARALDIRWGPTCGWLCVAVVLCPPPRLMTGPSQLPLMLLCGNAGDPVTRVAAAPPCVAAM